MEENPPYKSHPHNLLGKNCTDGVCKVKLNSNDVHQFDKLRVQCVKREDIMTSLQKRRDLNVNPFGQDVHNVSEIDLNSIRLCFQVISMEHANLYPVITSDVIRNSRMQSNAIIGSFSDNQCTLEEGQKITLFMNEKVSKNVEAHFVFPNSKFITVFMYWR